MPPVVVAASHLASALETGTAKLWMLLIGVNHYVDLTLPSLRYAAVDCQGIGAALSLATQAFPHKELAIYHDFAAELPTFAKVVARLESIVAAARSQDTVLIYFSGHGVVEPVTQQTVLCLRDTDCNNLLGAGLPIQVILQLLQQCAAQDRLLWLDACHSGNLSFVGAKTDRDATLTRLNPTAQLLASLRQGAAHSRGFYALLSCDEGQQSWEFPDLGHGVFSYYLMRGLRGEAADERGAIAADGLYRYVYRQTVQYIDTLNQQLRLADREQRDRGEMSWYPEYSPQTPKRIVAGVGEIVLGLQPSSELSAADRTALLVNLTTDPSAEAIGSVLQAEGKFTIDVVRTDTHSVANVGDRIQSFLTGESGGEPSILQHRSRPTRLLYLRGKIIELAGNDVGLEICTGVILSRNWLGRVLQRNSHPQQIIILDCAVAAGIQPNPSVVADWVAALNSSPTGVSASSSECLSQWMMVCIAPVEDADVFSQVLLEATISTPPRLGASVGKWLAIAQANLQELGICSVLSCSDTQQSQDILAGGTLGVAALTPPLQWGAGERSESPGTVGEPMHIDLENNDPDRTFSQDNTQFQPAVAPNVFFQDLAALLRRLFGPVASPLLARLELARVTDPVMAIELLLPLLPDRERDNFAIQVTALGNRQSDRSTPAAESEHSIPPSATPAAKTSPPMLSTSQPLHLSPHTRHEIEIALRRIVGPVAGVLLGQIEPTAWRSDRSLVAALAPYLTEQLIAQFDCQLQQIVQSASNASVEPDAGATPTANGRGIESVPTPSVPIAIDDKFIIACDRELTLAIGPIAKFIVATTYKAQPRLSRTDFAAILAAQIPDPIRAASFRERLNLS